ncbi:MAG TPA: hypothetical protein H9662_11200 [Firmicutes bacterium]|nr:hypothetical protein [Bacillota bacterium]
MILNPATIEINREDFEAIPEAQQMKSNCAINISPRGVISLNKSLLQQIRKHTKELKLGFECHKKDKRILLLYITDHPNYTFPEGGARKDKRFTRSLVEDGISIPARYLVEWNERANAWVGILNQETSTDALEKSLKAGLSNKRRKK